MECLDTHCSNLGQSFPAQPRVVQRSIFATIIAAVLVMYGFTVAYVSNQTNAANAYRSKNYATFDYPAPPNATNVGNPVIVQLKWTQVKTEIAGSSLMASLHFIYPASMLVGQAPQKAIKGVLFSFDSGQISIEQSANGMHDHLFSVSLARMGERTLFILVVFLTGSASYWYLSASFGQDHHFRSRRRHDSRLSVRHILSYSQCICDRERVETTIAAAVAG